MRRLVAEAAAEWSDRRCVLASALFGAGAGGPLGTNWAQTAVTVCHPPLEHEPRPPGPRWITTGYVEKVRPQLLSLRQLGRSSCSLRKDVGIWAQY